MVAVIFAASSSSLAKPAELLLDVLQPPLLFHLVQELVEVVAKSSLLHDLCTESGSTFNRDNILSTSGPLFEPLSHHDSIDHITHTSEFAALSVT